MRVVKNLLLVVAGAVLCLVGERLYQARPVHAQNVPASVCLAEVPKSWGEFKGASEYGLAFQDENGTLRFLLHPTCGNGYSSNLIPNPMVDLQLERK